MSIDELERLCDQADSVRQLGGPFAPRPSLTLTLEGRWMGRDRREVLPGLWGEVFGGGQDREGRPTTIVRVWSDEARDAVARYRKLEAEGKL
jgi:hypothetical protein